MSNINFIQPKRSDLYIILTSTLSQYKIKYTDVFLDKLANDHVDYPSLLSVGDVLQKYGVNSVAIRKGDYSYLDFETPYICAIQQEDWLAPPVLY